LPHIPNLAKPELPPESTKYLHPLHAMHASFASFLLRRRRCLLFPWFRQTRALSFSSSCWAFAAHASPRPRGGGDLRTQNSASARSTPTHHRSADTLPATPFPSGCSLANASSCTPSSARSCARSPFAARQPLAAVRGYAHSTISPSSDQVQRLRRAAEHQMHTEHSSAEAGDSLFAQPQPRDYTPSRGVTSQVVSLFVERSEEEIRHTEIAENPALWHAYRTFLCVLPAFSFWLIMQLVDDPEEHEMLGAQEVLADSAVETQLGVLQDEMQLLHELAAVDPDIHLRRGAATAALDAKLQALEDTVAALKQQLSSLTTTSVSVASKATVASEVVDAGAAVGAGEVVYDGQQVAVPVANDDDR
jgi:hypothetical protein